MAVIVINPYQYAAPIGPETDEPFENVSLLLYGNGPNNSTIFTDSSLYDHTISRYGNAKISTAQSKFGGSSMYFDGNGDYLSLPNDQTSFDFGTGKFTIECWIYNQGTRGNIFSQRHAYNTNNTGMTWRTGLNNDLVFWYGNGLGSFGTPNASLPANVWNHVALTRNGNTFTIWINGQARATNTITASMIYYPPAIGRVQGVAAEYFNGYIDDFRVTKGEARYTSSFTPPTSSLTAHWDPYFDEVSLMLHGDGANNSTTFTDSSLHDHTITVTGSVNISTVQSKYGGSSMDFNGGYVRAADSSEFAFGTGDFTVEAWLKGTSTFLETRTSLYSAGFGYSVVSNTIRVWDGQSNSFVYNGSTTYNWTNWHHVAISRSGTTLRVFVDGSLDGTATTSRNLTAQGGIVGANINKVLGSGSVFSGYIDDLRLTKGFARYTADFDVPQRAFPEQFGTPDTAAADCDVYADEVSLLLRGDGANNSTIFTDSSSNNHSITRYGNAKISTTQFKFGGSSMYFDGSGDYLTIPDDTSFHVGSGSFTIEFWIYRSSAPYTNIINKRPSSAAGKQWLYLSINTAGVLYFWATSNNSSWDIANGFNFGNSALSTGQWHHIALVRNGTEIAAYVDGTKASNTMTTSASIANGGTNTVQVGGDPAYNNYYVNGYIDDFRLTKGVARYTASFVPPTIPLPL